MPNSLAPVEDLPCDFSEFLAQRRQLSGEGTAGLVGDWLMNYSPGPIARSHAARFEPVRRAA
jgi:hypothetical protein